LLGEIEAFEDETGKLIDVENQYEDGISNPIYYKAKRFIYSSSKK